jgi:hypothetical protein
VGKSRWTWALFALWNAGVGAQAPGPNDPGLEAESPYMDEVRARPVPGDMAQLREVRAAFYFARDSQGREAVDRLLAAMAIAKLEGRTVPVSRTVGELVASPPPAPSRAELEKLLDSAVKPSLAGPDEMDASLVHRSQGELVKVSPGLWGTKNEIGSLKILWLPLRVENTSGHRIEEYGAYLLIDGAKLPSIRLACTRNARKSQMDAGESSFALCSNQGRGAERLEELKDALAQLPADPSRWRLEVSHVKFADPHVSVHRNGGVFFMDSDARNRVAADLRAADCRRRGACLADLKREVLETHPESLLVPLGFTVALVLGLWIGRRSGHISRAVMKVFLVLCLLLLAAIGYAIAVGGEWTLFLTIIVGIGGAAAVGTFMIVTLVGVWIGRAFRPAGNRGLTPI